jgi:glycosyltransferase involved in cell wall biosynthesis
LRVHDFKIFQHRAVKWVLAYEERYDVIQVCELPEFVQEYKRRGGSKPVVARLTAPDYYDPCHGFLQADAIIASGATMEAVRSRGLPVQDVPNGVDTEVFSSDASVFRERWPNDKILAVCVARFQTVKGHEILLQAFKSVVRADRRWILVLAGSGPEMARMQRLCRQFGLMDNVEFMGETPHEMLPDIYRAADIVVIPSLYESFCFAALEGMASGKPIISSATPWIPRLLGADESKESENIQVPGGWIVPVGDSEALARAMLRLQNDPERRRVMGERNREEVVRKYGWGESARKLGELYTEIVRKAEN